MYSVRLEKGDNQMGDITISSAVRSNLTAMQSTVELMNQVQNRLATGKKVNSALDNPNSFFTADGLQSRAGDLNGLLDDMGQSVQTLRAADQGLKGITKLVESAKAKANQALQSQSQYERQKFSKEYNDLLGQIEDLAKDSSYKGKNLLGGTGNDLTVIFNEDNTSKLTVSAVDYTDSTDSDGLNLSDLAEGASNVTSIQLEGGTDNIVLTDGTGNLNSSSLLTDSDVIADGDTLTIEDTAAAAGTTVDTLVVGATTTVQDLVDFIDGTAGVEASFDDSDGTLTIVSNDDTFLYTDDLGQEIGGASASPTDLISSSSSNFAAATDTLVSSASYTSGDTLTFTDGNGYEVGSLEVDDTTTVQNLVDALDDGQGISASFSTTTGKITVDSEVDLAIVSDNSDFNASAFTADTDGVNIDTTDSGFSSDSDINNSLDRLNSALSTLRSQASTFGTNLSVVENRQSFTKAMINTLEEGAGKLTLADPNQEGANLLALQTRQALASTALAISAQADQNVLRLF